MILKNNFIMKTLNMLLMLLLAVGSIDLAQSQTTIPWRSTGTKTKPTTTQQAAPQPMQVTPKTGSGIVIGGAVAVNPFTNTSNLTPMADGTNLTVTLLANPGNLPKTLGGNIVEEPVAYAPSISSTPGWTCQSVTKVFSATSDNFLTSEYSATSTSIFPGAIYTATDFLKGNRKAFEYSRNPVEIGVDNVLNTVGSTYRVVDQPTQNQINSAISSIAQTMTGSGEDIKYRIYISESEAEMALNLAADGKFGGFSMSAAYGNRSRERVRVMTIDATKTYFTTSVNLPANGYFSDKSIEQNNANMVAIKNVVWGCRVLANVYITVTNNQDEANFMAQYSGVGTDARGVFNYLKSHSNFESKIDAMVIGGPTGTTTFTASKLEEDISNLMARANYRTARPIAYTLTDMYGNVLGIQSATDRITVPECVPDNAVYTLKNARIEVITGMNDPKNDGSSALFELYNASKQLVASDRSVNNIEFPTGSTHNSNLNIGSTDPNIVGINKFTAGEAHIFFTPINIALGWDEWQIRSIVLNLQFVDQFGAPYPGGNIRLTYDNVNIYLKKDRQRLVIPFSFDGALFNTGGPFQPTGTSNFMNGIQNSLKN